MTWSVVEAGGGSVSPAGLYSAPAAAGIFTVKAVSQADSTKSAVVQIQVVAAPAIGSFTSTSPFAFPTQGVTLTPVFSNGTASISGGIGTVASGTAYPVAPTATTTYTLTVTNSAGSTVTSDVAITFSSQAPSVATLTASPSALVDFGQPLTVSWTLAGGPATSLTFGGANVTGQNGMTVTPERRFAYGLTATNPVGASAPSYIILTARGLDLFSGNMGGQGFHDGPGAQAQFTYLWYIAKDSAGNFYLADEDTHSIRKVTPAGVTSTFAGLPLHSGTADGLGSAARFNNPEGLAFDANGNLFVADTSNHTIRKITPAGVVTTFAGQSGASGNVDGLGSAARFTHPNGMAFDAAGNLYVSDPGTYTIRKITPAGQVTTLAGQATHSGSVDAVGLAAKFGTLRALVYDQALNCLFIADAGNSTLRKLDLVTNAVTTVAGMPGTSGNADGIGSAARLDWTCGLALDNQGNVLMADYDSSTIRKFVPGTQAVTTIAGNGTYGHVDGPVGSASFRGPVGLWAEANGDIFVTDYDEGTFRKISGGQVSTVAGTPLLIGSADGGRLTARFSYPNALCLGPNGKVNVLDNGNHTIRQMDIYGSVTTLAGSPGIQGSADGSGSAASFSSTFGGSLGVDTAGNLYLGDSSNHTIRKVTPAGVVTTLAGLPGVSGTATGTGSAARFSSPAGTAVDSSGNIFVADAYNAAIRKITPAGVVTNFAGLPGAYGSTDGTGTAARFNLPIGLAIDGAGNLYVTDSNNNSIRKITPAGVVTTLAGGTPGSADGQGAAAQFIAPSGITALTDGTLYVTDGNTTLVRRVSATGLVTTLAGTPGTFGSSKGPLPGTLNACYGITVISNGDLLISDPDGITQITAPEGH